MKKALYIIVFLISSIKFFGQVDSLKNTPNQFVTNTTFNLYVANHDTLTINIYNQWGTLVYTPFSDSVFNTGPYSFVWYTGSLPDMIYVVVLRNKSGNLHTLHAIKNVNAGIAQFENPYDLKVYPNPASESISIETTQKFNLIKIYSFDGKMVKEINNPQRNFPVSDFPAGIYTAMGFNKEKCVFNYKFSVIK